MLPVIFLMLGGISKNSGDVGAARKLRPHKFVGIAAIGLFFLLVISSYSQLHRSAYWDNMEVSQTVSTLRDAPDIIPSLAVALETAIPGTDAFSQMHHYPTGAVWHLINRLAVTSWAATAIELVDVAGTREDSLLGAMFGSIVPRILFPDKPQISYGRDIAIALGQASSWDTATTASSLSMFGFFYWWGGIVNLVMMSILS